MKRMPDAVRALLITCLIGMSGSTAASETVAGSGGPVRVVTVASGLEHPWGLAFLPDGRMLVTERPGRLRIASADGALSEPASGVPSVYAVGQGGLLDVALDPQFPTNRLVYLAYAEAEGRSAGTVVARGKLAEAADGQPRLTDVQVIFRQRPKVSGHNHWGARLVFAPDGTLFVTLGERYHKERAQNLDETLGKVVRINPDGSIPDDNPFVGRSDVLPEIWSIGHRNIQAAAINPWTKQLWTIEHGAQGGDEINIPQPGKNYGWPIITYGRDYSGAKIGEGTAKEGLEQPVFYWDPSIAPSGMAFYTGDLFPAWKGNLFVGALAAQSLARLEIGDAAVRSEERLLEDLGERIRDVRQGPEGALYLLTDADDGRILRLEPAR